MKLLSSYSTFLVLTVLSFVPFSHSQSPITQDGRFRRAVPTTPFTTTFTSPNVIIVNGQSQTQDITITQIVTPTPQTTSNGNSSNSNQSNNNKNNQTSTSSKPSNLPTANPSVDGGGNPGGLAPSPGGGNGAFGPGDSFVAGALMLQVNIALMTLAGVGVGMAMIF